MTNDFKKLDSKQDSNLDSNLDSKQDSKKVFWCLHKNCIYTSKECFNTKLDLLEHCRECH